MLRNYETVFIMNPVLSDDQVRETVSKFETLLKDNGAEIVSSESWGLKKMAYAIQKKKSGFYHLTEFKASGEVIAKLETEFRRDERVMRFLTMHLDKHAAAWAEKRRSRVSNKKTA
ncbi:MAG: small subunit ribosomal protein S6 [Flavobacteriales bacterium]|jgi:small subunit ribosomal protein S6